jgi:hypothetical protein
MIIQQLDLLSPKDLFVCKLASVLGVEFLRKALYALYEQEKRSAETDNKDSHNTASSSAAAAPASSNSTLSAPASPRRGSLLTQSTAALQRASTRNLFGHSPSNSLSVASSSSSNPFAVAAAASQHQANSGSARPDQSALYQKQVDFALSSLEVHNILSQRSQHVWAFTNPLVQRCCYELLLHAQRVRLHFIVAQWYVLDFAFIVVSLLQYRYRKFTFYFYFYF